MILTNKTIESHLSCTSCSLHENRTQVVLPDSNSENTTTLVAVGEAPGADEDLLGFGFAGRAGRTLDKLLSIHGIQRMDYARANMVCCRPPNNRKPKKAELKACEGWLQWWLTRQFPIYVVLAIGGTPSTYFYGCHSLSEAIRLAKEREFKPLVAWAENLLVVPSPHTSPLAFNRRSPGGEKWSDVARAQISTACTLLKLRGVH